MTSNKNSYRSKEVRSSSVCCPDSVLTSGNSNRSATSSGSNSCCVAWSGFETIGMRRAKYSLLLQDDIIHDAIIKKLPKQRVLIDRGVHTINDHGSSSATSINPAVSSSSPDDVVQIEETKTSNPPTSTHCDPTIGPYYVDFNGATILQLEPSINPMEPQSVMPITITVAGKCVFTPEN